MESHSLWVPGALATLLLAGCAANSSSIPRAATKPAITTGQDAQLTRYRVRNWSAPDNHTLIVESYDGTQYKGETLGPCQGLDFTSRLSFRNRGGFADIDRFTSVVLPDGTTCQFQSFSKVITPEASALDRYEKSQKAAEKKAAANNEGDAKKE